MRQRLDRVETLTTEEARLSKEVDAFKQDLRAAGAALEVLQDKMAESEAQLMQYTQAGGQLLTLSEALSSMSAQREESDRTLRQAAEQELSLQVKINSLQESLNREAARIEQTRKDRTIAEREFKTFNDALEAETTKLRQHESKIKAGLQEAEARLLKVSSEAEKAETQRQRIAAELESLQDRREEFAQAEAQLKKWNEIERRLRGQLEELEEKHDMLRRGLPTEEATVVMFANDIIKRIDLIDALIQRYGTVNGSDADEQLQTLRASFEDILHQHGIVEFDVASGTEVDVDLRKRIAVVDSVPGKAKPRVTETFRSGFIYSREDGHEIVLRKVEVRTSSQ